MIYFLCPYHRTGGPENTHLLVSMLNEIAGSVVSTLVYLPPFPPNPNLYPEIDGVHIGVLHQIHDIPTNVVVVPEIYCVRRMRQELKVRHCQYVVWWQSYVHACINYTLGNWSLPDVWHAFHSYYQYAMVRPHLSSDKTWFFLTDFIADAYTSFDASPILSQKEDIVCFNGHKDNLTKSVCKAHDIPYIEIKSMSREQVMTVMKRCKVYVDMGSHPGKDHMPREAAMMGCVVITNKSGSAAYWEDVPILEKVSYDTELPILIRKAFVSFHDVYRQQTTYRDKILAEKSQARHTAQDFLSRLGEHTSKYDCLAFATYDTYHRFKTFYRSFVQAFRESSAFQHISSEQKEWFIKPDALDDGEQTIYLLNVMTFATCLNHVMILTYGDGTHTYDTYDVLALLFSIPNVKVTHLHLHISPSSGDGGDTNILTNDHNEWYNHIRRSCVNRYEYIHSTPSTSSFEKDMHRLKNNVKECRSSVYITMDTIPTEYFELCSELITTASFLMYRFPCESNVREILNHPSSLHTDREQEQSTIELALRQSSEDKYKLLCIRRK